MRLLICSEAEADLHAYRRSREPGLAVRFIRGRRCAVLDRCMGEFAAAMQLPYCFEGTWASLRQSLAELVWPEGTRLMLVVTCVNRVLPRAGDEFAAMLRTLADFAQDSGGAGDVQVVFHAEPRYQADVQRRIVSTGINIQLVEE